MNSTLAQLDPNLLSLTGVIATILAVIFAVGAYYNSRTRKKHLMELERAQKQEQAMHFRPMKPPHPAARSALPSRSTLPHQTSGTSRSSVPRASSPRSSTPKAAPVAKASSRPAEAKKEMEKKPDSASSSVETPQLFRKVRPSGAADLAPESDRDDQDEYIWE